MISYLKSDENLTEVTFDRLNNMVEFLICYPLEVRKDKNASVDMEHILHMKDASYHGKVGSNRAQKIMMFVWSKMCDQQKNIGQTFRIFDSKN